MGRDFTAIPATIGAIVELSGRAHAKRGSIFQERSSAQKGGCLNQWAYYQAKSTKQSPPNFPSPWSRTKPKRKIRSQSQNATSRKGRNQKADKFDAESAEANKKSQSALHLHDKLAESMTFIQIAISWLQFVLTRRRWMLGLAGVAAGVGVVYWILAFTVTAYRTSQHGIDQLDESSATSVAGYEGGQRRH